MVWCGSRLGLVSVQGNLTLQSRLRMFSGLIRRMDGAAHLILLRRIPQLSAFAPQWLLRRSRLLRGASLSDLQCCSFHPERLRLLARIIHECRREAIETEASRGFSQVRPTQANAQSVEEAEREKPRRARGSDDAAGIHE